MPDVGSTPSVALTIAGSDSGGGAGIQADLVTFAALGVHGTSAITALTAQNTVGVAGVHVPPVTFLRAQLDAVLADLPVAAVKTGMLATEDVVVAVAEYAAAGRLPNLVVDPVLVSSTGARLLDPGAEAAYLDLLLPHARVVTPNTREAAALLGRPVGSIDDARDAARQLATCGPAWVVVTGGHLSEAPTDDLAVDLDADTEARGMAEAADGTIGRALEAARDAAADMAVDVVYDAASDTLTELRLPRVVTPNDHGTGCTFAAATAARLARGSPVPEALDAAKRFVHEGLAASASWALGACHGPVGKLGAWRR